MKNFATAALLSAIVLGAASRPALAAAPKGDAKSAAIAAALTAVSPDPLGGQFGLVVATARANERAPGNRIALLQNAGDSDRRAYAAWKSAKN
jgi:hypothetical protein